MNKKYIVYYWSKSDADAIEKDYEKCLEEFIDIDQFSVITDYGEKVGTFDDENEALKFAANYADKSSHYDMVAIWDSEERKWFN